MSTSDMSKPNEQDVCTAQSREEDRRLYCLCKSPDDPSLLMVQCDFCEEWYHPKCVGVAEDGISNIAVWHCPPCVEIMKLNPCVSHKGLQGFQGRVAPTKGWGDEFPITADIDEEFIIHNVQTKRHKVEGWTLFREGRVTSLSSNRVDPFIYFRGCAKLL